MRAIRPTRTRSLATICLVLAILAHAHHSDDSDSDGDKVSNDSKTPDLTLGFEVPLPMTAPGTNTSSGCGKELESGLSAGGGTAGPFTFNTADGYNRTYTIHIPTLYTPTSASPLIFGLPGNSQTYHDIETDSRLSEDSVNPYAIVVYVQGVKRGFVSNPGYGDTLDARYPKVDDIDFMTRFIDDLAGRFCVDLGRLWVVGHSNGGGLTNVMACDPVLSTKISAFAANSGAFYTNQTVGDPKTVATDTTVQRLCSPGRRDISYIEFHGTDDQTIDYEGSDRHSSNGIRVLPAIQHWASSWALRNGLDSEAVISRPTDNVTVYQWGNGMVTHYQLEGWTHAYASKAAAAPVDATPMIIEFFYQQTNLIAVGNTATNIVPAELPMPTAKAVRVNVFSGVWAVVAAMLVPML